MTPVLPLEISTKINNFLRPIKEGFRVQEGQYHQCNPNYVIYIADVQNELLENKIIIRGYRIFNNEEGLRFLILADKQNNKFKDFSCYENNKSIRLEKTL